MNSLLFLSICILVCSAELCAEDYIKSLDALVDSCTTSINNAPAKDLYDEVTQCGNQFLEKANDALQQVRDPIYESSNYLYTASNVARKLEYEYLAASYAYQDVTNVMDGLDQQDASQVASVKESAVLLVEQLRDICLALLDSTTDRSGGKLADLKNELMCDALNIEGFRPYYSDVPGSDEVQVYASVSSCEAGYAQNTENYLASAQTCLRCANIEGTYQWHPMNCRYLSVQHYLEVNGQSEYKTDDFDDICVRMNTPCSTNELEELNSVLFFQQDGAGNDAVGTAVGYLDGCRPGTKLGALYDRHSGASVLYSGEVRCERYSSDAYEWVALVEVLKVGGVSAAQYGYPKYRISLEYFDAAACY